jgi:hypothetical protein
MIAVLAVTLFPLCAVAAEGGFELKDTAGDHLDVLLDGKVVARYMYAHDASNKDRHLETYKPYLHVMDAEGKEPITQGAGGKQFPHHRGIYIGWQQMNVGGKKYNFWEMASGDIIHTKFADQKADANGASFTSLTKWVPKDSDQAVIEEERTMTFHRGPSPAVRLVIDFTSKVKAVAADTTLDANAEHCGVQYRPAGDIVAKETVYTFPGENTDPKKDFDLAWAGETYTLRGKRYSVVEINSPENPKQTHWSAYRDYGRFGAAPTAKLKQGETLTLKYRFLIADGEMPSAEVIQKSADEFTGAATATPTPKTTVKPADGAEKKK